MKPILADYSGTAASFSISCAVTSLELFYYPPVHLSLLLLLNVFLNAWHFFIFGSRRRALISII